VDFTFTFDDDAGEVTIVLEGTPRAEDFRALTASLTADRRYRSGLAHLVDCSRLEPGSVSPEAIQDEVAPLIERDWNYPPRAVAIVAPDPRVFDRAVWARAHMGGGSTANRRVFTGVSEARTWLATQPSV